MQTNIPPALQDLTVLETWTGPRAPQYERDHRWNAIAGTLVIAGAAYGIVFDSLLFSIVCVLTAGLYFFTRNHEPTEHTCTILRQGVLYDNAYVRWEDIAGFWFVRTQTSFDLHLQLRQQGQPEIRIQLPPEQGEHARFVLAQFTLELHNRKEHILDTIIRFCKL